MGSKKLYLFCTLVIFIQEHIEENCLEVYANGKWNNDVCEKQMPSICKKLAKTEWCEAALVAGDQKWCGYRGMTEDECVKEYGCCWNEALDAGDGNHCFQPVMGFDFFRFHTSKKPLYP